MIRLGLFAILFLLEALDRQELFFRYFLEQQLFPSPELPSHQKMVLQFWEGRHLQT